MTGIRNYQCDCEYTNRMKMVLFKVNRASLACGPMVKWAKAQLSYAKMLNKVEPLNNELKRLEKDAEEKTKKGVEVKHKIEELEERIQGLKVCNQ